MRPEPQLREKIRAWIRQRRHWLFAYDARERPLLDQLFVAVERAWWPGTPKVPIDLLDLDFVTIDAASGAETPAGVLWLAVIPRAALSVETIQAVMRAHHGAELSCEALLARPFIAPVAASDWWAVGARLHLFECWLLRDAEDDDAG
jgi:hypothetical protein